MASIFGFRSRSASRDEETDRLRFARIEQLLDSIASEIASEHEGLERRYRASAANAAFLADTMENEGTSGRSSDRLDDLTSSIIRCERRLEALLRQGALISQLKETVTAMARTVTKETQGNDDQRSSVMRR